MYLNGYIEFFLMIILIYYFKIFIYLFFMEIGGWIELENVVKCFKMEYEKDYGIGDINWLYLIFIIGFLNCRRIWFVYIKKLSDSMEFFFKILYDEVEKNYWRSIYFLVEFY